MLHFPAIGDQSALLVVDLLFVLKEVLVVGLQLVLAFAVYFLILHLHHILVHLLVVEFME